MNPVIGTRSFGRTPRSVSLYGLTAFLAARPHTALVGKHFPGHGMSRVDSHLALPAVKESRQGMESIHLRPFVEACGVGIDGLMISHCTYTAFQDDNLPASLSGQIVGDLLRKKIGFRRLVITDSLDMHAVTRTIEPRQASMLAHQAGCDVLLYTKYSRRFEESFEAFVKALLSGQIPGERLAASLSRRGALIHRLRSSPKRPAVTGRETYLALRERVLAKALRIRDPKRLLPVAPKKVALISTRPEIRARLRSYVPTVREARASSVGNGALLFLWLMEPLKMTCPLKHMKELIERSDTAILVTSYQALADLLPRSDVTIVTYDSSPQTEKAILKRIFG